MPDILRRRTAITTGALNFIALYPWLLLPGLFVIIFVISFNFMGDGLRAAADPYR